MTRKNEDASSRVQTRQANGDTRLWQYSHSGQLLFSWSGPAHQKTHEYIYLAGSLLATIDHHWPSNLIIATRYQHTDALGSPVALSDELGAVVERHVYEPYGAIVGKPAYSGIGYTGHVMDGGIGLTYMQQRYYDQSIGRFLSVDPVAADSGTGANFNRYKYAENNPYRFLDPDGRRSREEAQHKREVANRQGDSTNEPANNSVSSTFLNNLTEPWGGPDGLADAISCVIKCGLPGDGSLTSQLGALPPVVFSANGVFSNVLNTLKTTLGGTKAGSGGLRLSGTVAGHLTDIVKKGPYKGELARPYLNSQLLVQQIMRSSKGVPDPGGVSGATRWDVPGVFRGSQGTWELVVHDGVILHFNFVR